MKFVSTLGSVLVSMNVVSVTIESILRLAGDYRTIAPNQSTHEGIRGNI